MLFVISRLDDLIRKKQIPLYAYLIDLTKAYEFVTRTFLWTVLAVLQKMISAIRQVDDSRWLDNGECSNRFSTKGVYLFVPLPLNFFASVIHMVFRRFK